jgi:ATP-dependent DNA helicase RecQ
MRLHDRAPSTVAVHREAAAGLVDGWRPDPAPAWVTSVPSARSGAFVHDAASRLADALGLPYVPEALVRTREAPPQREMENSPQQVRNVFGAFVAAGEVPAGPVLLVDDTVDSGWTITVAGQALLAAGVGAVHPFVFAKATSD